MDYATASQLESYVSACAEKSGVKVIWDEPNSVPRTDGHRMYLPRLTSKTTEDFVLKLKYYIKHETSHIVHTNFDWFAKKGVKGLLQLICNMLEDNRIDYLNDMEYAA